MNGAALMKLGMTSLGIATLGDALVSKHFRWTRRCSVPAG